MGVYEGSQVLGALTLGSNAFRMGTDRGKYEPDPLASSTVTISLPAGDQQAYSAINLLMTGSNGGEVTYDVDGLGTNVPKKRAWTEVTAHYSDASSELVWTSPKGATYIHTDLVEYDIAGGIPRGTGFAEQEPGVWDAAYITSFNTVLATSMFVGTVGGGTIENPRRTHARAGDLYMYDVAGGIPVNQNKTLTGVTVLVTSGSNTGPSGYVEGDHVNVYAMVGTPAGGGPTYQADFDGDGDVDLDDFVILKKGFGLTMSP
jgi:hypothetical protein